MYLCYRVVDLVSAPRSVVSSCQTLQHNTSPVRRFHSVRKCLSYDGANTQTRSTESGLSADDNIEIYSNWSPRRLSDIQDLTISDEDISTTDCWVSETLEFTLSYCCYIVLLLSVQ